MILSFSISCQFLDLNGFLDQPHCLASLWSHSGQSLGPSSSHAPVTVSATSQCHPCISFTRTTRRVIRFPNANLETSERISWCFLSGPAAASALTGPPKTSAVASAVLRPTQPTKVHIPSGPSTLIPSAQMRNQVLSGGRSGSPAATIAQEHEPTR